MSYSDVTSCGKSAAFSNLRRLAIWLQSLFDTWFPMERSMSNKFNSHTLAVTGASGHLGRRVVELLLERGAQHVVA
jgi:FlaA1/EpsC-like NDP-sugar epimerase